MSTYLVKHPVADFDRCALMGGKPTTRVGLRTLAARWAEWRSRLSLHRLLDLDARLIDDIGLTNEEIRAALKLPLRENAIASMVQRAALRRREDLAALRQRKPITGLQQW